MGIFKAIQPQITKAACGCHVGKKRKNNEDNFYFDGSYAEIENMGLQDILTLQTTMLDAVCQRGSFFAVFDGMGGGDYGEIASYTAARNAKIFFAQKNQMDPHDITVSLECFCNIVNEEVFHAGSNLGTDQMGTTIASLYFFDGRVWVCNLGDSRCFRLRQNRLQQISMDHTDENEMKANGITGRKPYLTQYLGMDPEEIRIEPHIKSYELNEGDIFLLCSDGLTDMVSPEDICRLLVQSKDPQEAVNWLMQEALAAGGKDNITVIICQIG